MRRAIRATATTAAASTSTRQRLLAIERAKQLFKCKFANVQPHSGSTANQAAFMALMKPGDTFMGLSLAAGGHLTHGSPVNLSGKWFKVVPYTVRRQDHRIDMDEMAALARQHKPKVIVAGGSAYPRTIDFAAFRAIADEVGAETDGGHGALRRAGCRRRASEPLPARACGDDDHAQDAARPARRHDPHQRRGPRQEDQLGGVPRHAGRAADAHHRRQGGGASREALQPEFQAYARAVAENAKALGEVLSSSGFDLVSGGTDTHLLLVDLRPKKLTGNRAEKALSRANITTNKNGVPFDPEKPQVTSGIRVGSPAGTTRGFGIAEFRAIGRMIAEVLDGLAANGEEGNAKVEAKVKAEAIGTVPALSRSMHSVAAPSQDG